ncbi:MAG TPA: protein kinase, partial [Pyrinomonadaceae bacterium]|nr:protein kinase [Pyrinomonadaceae bacterium]
MTHLDPMIGKTISHYRILGQIGEGGMGVVYVAEDSRFGRRVAIKIPHAGKDESHYRSRFLKEARAVSKLNHRNIATVYDMGETDDGRPYIVMELVSGQTLGDVLAGPGLSVARSVEVMREVAEALAEAHSHKIIHRDVKPSNVIISDKGDVKVLDFGLAKQLEDDGSKSRALSEHTRSDVVIGTPLYLSPEQARSAKDVDARSDLFALGALLYECVTGRPAFSGASVIEIGAQVLHFDPPPASRSNPRVTAELDRLIKRALSKKPEDRFQTAKEFSEELTRVRARIPASDVTRTRRLAGVDTLARSSAFITMAETLKRPRLSLLSVLGVAAAAALLLFGVYYLFIRRPLHAPGPEAVALYEQGVEALREGANFRATGLLGQAVEADDEYALAHARLAEAWTELEFLDRAKDEMLAAKRLVPDMSALEHEDALYFDAILATVSRHPAEAVKKYEELARLKTDPQRLVDLGRAYVKNDETQKAVDAFTQAAALDEAYAAASLSLGALHARTKNLAGATAAFDRAEKLYARKGNREGEAEVHYQRGRLLIELSRKPEAERELSQALLVARSTGNVYQQVQALLQLAHVPEDLAQAKAYADEAIGLAQSNSMQNLAARGYIDLGALYLASENYAEAEPPLLRALEFARDYKVRRLQALALFSLANIRDRQNRFEEAAKLAAEARDYYAQNGFRREATQAAILLARVKGKQGDYAAALVELEEQIKLTEPTGDTRLLGLLHRECGSMLARKGDYVNAVRHSREAIDIATGLSDNTTLSYGLLNIAGSLWQLGRYDEAAQALAQLLSGTAGSQGSDKDNLTTLASLVEADMALSQGRLGDAREKGGRVLAAAQANGRKGVTADADVILCLAETLGGAPERGRPRCEEAARFAAASGDPLAVSNTQLATAEVLLGAGDAAGARDMALAAEEFFARAGRVESDWRALVIAGKACRLAGDEAGARKYFARAAEQLARLEESWGGDAAGYLSRQDVQRLRREL